MNKLKLIIASLAIALVSLIYFGNNIYGASANDVSYVITAFTQVGSHNWVVPAGVTQVDFLMVGGGGSGGTSAGGSAAAGGGGAGGLIFNTNYDVVPGENIAIYVGQGGLAPTSQTDAQGAAGENSTAFGLTAFGGGGGGSRTSIPGGNGGSGGGAGPHHELPGSALDNGTQGNSGGGSGYSGLSSDPNNAGGGGGFKQAGLSGLDKNHGGGGGQGLYLGNVFGIEYGDGGWFAGGGGGGASLENTPGLGGNGGGGRGGFASTPAINALANTGGGGGGQGGSTVGAAAGNGGSGIVIIRYVVPNESGYANYCTNRLCRLSPNSSLLISAHGVSRSVHNADLNREIFIPIYNSLEWAQFRIHYPAHIVFSIDQATPVIGGCSSTVWGTDCTVTASGGESTGSYEFDYVSGDCSINPDTGVVSSSFCGTCVVRVRKLGDTYYNTSDWSSNYSIILANKKHATPAWITWETPRAGVDQSVICANVPTASQFSFDHSLNSAAYSLFYSGVSREVMVAASIFGAAGNTSQFRCRAEASTCYDASDYRTLFTARTVEIDPCLGQTTATFNYNGSQVTYGTVSKGGLCWLDRNLGATRSATSSTDTQSYGDLFQWGRGADGHQRRSPLSGTTSTTSSSDNPGTNRFITISASPHDWRNPQNTNLWQGATGVNNPCPAGWRIPTEAELNVERLSWSSQNSAGAYASTLNWSVAGYRTNNSSLINVGFVGGVWSSTVSSTNSRFLSFYASDAQLYSYNRAHGFSVRCLRDFSPLAIKYSSTTGGSISGATEQIVASGGSGTAVTAVPDTGYVFARWSDGVTTNPRTDTNVTSDINVEAQFEIDPCRGQTSVTFNYNGSNVTYNTVRSGDNCWLDRNLGATRAATSSTDSESYGDLFQWGRLADGHQIRTSGTTSTRSSGDVPGHENFITNSTSPYDWRDPQNANLWQGATGVNNPCPSGWRIPTDAELDAEILGWSSNNSAGAYASALKWSLSGSRTYNGSINVNNGYAWSSAVSGSGSGNLFFNSSIAFMASGGGRAAGAPVRCLRLEIPPPTKDPSLPPPP